MSTTSTMNIALPEPMRAYVAKRVESGQFGNTSEYVRELIRRDQREQDMASAAGHGRAWIRQRAGQG